VADRDADIIVVGAGITGVATARELARRRFQVLLLEQFELRNSRGSSHGTSRIFRLAYPDSHYVRLAQSALSAWRELEAECGNQLIRPTGSLDLGPIALIHARALAACGVRHEVLAGAEVSARWPIAVEAEVPALFQADGGITLADRAYAAFLDGAREAGAVTREHSRVLALITDRGAVRVELESGEVLRALAVVVVAGAWAQRLLDGHGIELGTIPTRETTTFFAVPADDLPTVIDDALTPRSGRGRAGELGYALAAPGDGLKAGLHHSGPVTDPDDHGEPDPDAVAWASEWVSRRFAGGAIEPTRAETCIYTNRADASFVLERHGRIVVGAACSGHGFKFAPTHGLALAALAQEAAA
jgi:sarcosine oxidase